MKILAIETSCDETAISILECSRAEPYDPPGGGTSARFSVLGNALLSQVMLHAEYGGVFPSLAKREHSKNLIPLLKEVFRQAGFAPYGEAETAARMNKTETGKVKKILEREPELSKQFFNFVPFVAKPPLDAIAVTHGPGLEPALWVGINLARALSLAWSVPVMPINHMEGHIISALLKRKDSVADTFGTRPQVTTYSLQTIQFPALALLISGGHTELVLMSDWLNYKVVGETRDDAVGEAFDKVARMLSLPYPGGPEISRLAEQCRNRGKHGSAFGQSNAVSRPPAIKLPRPMLLSEDFDFSFSGLKTAVLYLLKKLSQALPASAYDEKFNWLRENIAKEFEDAVAEVLIKKALAAADSYKARTLILGGGVSANKHIREEISLSIAKKLPRVTLVLPEPALTGDNAVTIAATACIHLLNKKAPAAGADNIKAMGNLRL
jgi:N6-L-threonylcarbamoyladenine synthase